MLYSFYKQFEKYTILKPDYICVILTNFPVVKDKGCPHTAGWQCARWNQTGSSSWPACSRPPAGGLGCPLPTLMPFQRCAWGKNEFIYLGLKMMNSQHSQIKPSGSSMIMYLLVGIPNIRSEPQQIFLCLF